MKNLLIILVILSLMTGCKNEQNNEITAAAFGDIYDMSDGAPGVLIGGSYNDSPSGDTWYTTWAGNDTLYINNDDGLGFNNIGGQFARSRICMLNGNPNISTDGFIGTNLNPGVFGKTLPNNEATSEWRIGYTSSIYSQNGILYQIRHNWSPIVEMWPPINSSIIKSTDGGRNWINHLGQTNTPLPEGTNAMFAKLPWTWLNFIQYGKDGVAPAVDNADKYTYLTAGGEYLVRIPRIKLKDLNKNDYQYFKGGSRDGLVDSSWSTNLDDAGKIQFIGNDTCGIGTVVYNFALKRYIGTGARTYVAPTDTMWGGKSRFGIYTAEHHWGPWKGILSYGIWSNAGWQMMMANKFTSPDGKKMWYNFCGGFKSDLWNYGVQYNPLYLSTGAVDKYEAENAALTGTSIASTYPSFSGTGYVNNFAKQNDKATFNIDHINGTGWHIVRIRYTSPQANAEVMSIDINGKKVKRVKFSLNNSNCQPFLNWTDRSDIYYLNNGTNTFEIRQDEGDNGAGFMVDYIAVSRETTYDEGKNVAPEATATASSGNAIEAINGCPGDNAHEWSANGAAGEWIKLDWKSPQKINKVLLYDKVSTNDQVTSGTLQFSDGTSMTLGKLQNDGQAGNVLAFPTKTITWIKYTVNSVRSEKSNAGLSEFEVYAPTDSVVKN
jgi:hypothetical protein